MMNDVGDGLEFRGMGRRDEKQDRLLVQECLAGSEAAWQEFYARFIGLIRSVIRRQSGLTPADVQDIVQSVFLDLTTALNAYDAESSLPHFVCVIAERVLIDEFRKGKAAKRHAETQMIDQHDGNEEGAAIVKSDLEPQDSQMERAELSLHLKSAVDELDTRCRELIRLRYYKELPFGEIAEMLGVSENTLTVQTRRCLDKLRTAFQDLERRGIRP
jgi:RNA polymerase sigma-70 factor, ECF subfamily